MNNLLRTGPTAGVVELTKLQKELQSSGSAEFATQMIRRPEEQSIKWVSQKAQKIV
jgi:hypothetical protein